MSGTILPPVDNIMTTNTVHCAGCGNTTDRTATIRDPKLGGPLCYYCWAPRDEFLEEVRKLGGSVNDDTYQWYDEALVTGLTKDDTSESLAWVCVDDELANIDIETKAGAEFAQKLKSALQYARG